MKWCVPKSLLAERRSQAFDTVMLFHSIFLISHAACTLSVWPPGYVGHCLQTSVMRTVTGFPWVLHSLRTRHKLLQRKTLKNIFTMQVKGMAGVWGKDTRMFASVSHRWKQELVLTSGVVRWTFCIIQMGPIRFIHCPVESVSNNAALPVGRLWLLS